MDIIEIDKNSIPYEFDIELNNRLYTMAINYNYLFDFFTVDLMLNDEVLVKGEKLIIDKILFSSLCEDNDYNIDEMFPDEYIVPVASNDSIERITFDNLNNDVLLYVVSREELTNE